MIRIQLIILTFLFMGLLFIGIGLTRDKCNCNGNKIIYKYLPSSDQLFDDPSVSQVFKKMFDNPEPWIAGINTYDQKQQDNTKNFYKTN